MNYRRHLFVLLVLAVPLLCYGFGKNKVQYAALNWHYYRTPHFDIYHHQHAEPLALSAATMMEHSYDSLKAAFDFVHERRMPLIVYGSPTLFEQTNIITELIPENVGGFTELFKNRIVVPFNGSYAEFQHVLFHELVHGFQFGILYDNAPSSLFRSSAMQMPLWFAEGSAEYLSSGWSVDADIFLMDMALNGTIALPGPELNGYMAYKGGQSFLHFLHTSQGDSLFGEFLQAFRRSKKAELSLEKTYGVDLEDLGKQWHQQLKRNYWPEIGKRETPEPKSRNLSSKLPHKTQFNLMPRLSPDGTKIAFYSDVHDYTKILITDTKGKILTSISQHGYGGYFESFNPFRSGLCWSPKGDQLAFVTKNQGRDEIRIVNINTHRLSTKIQLPQFSGLFAPDWSADGQQLVFGALDNHQTDIFLYSLQTQSLRRLTNDKLYETTPRFAPDGAAIIYSSEDTCAFSTPASAYGSGPGDLYLLSLSDSIPRQLTKTPWSESAPSFAPDGKDIVFVSNQSGLQNLYLAKLDAVDSAVALTDFAGSIASADWAPHADTLAFTLFQKGSWQVYLMDTPRTKKLSYTPEPTRWIQAQQDSAHPFFTPFVLERTKKETPDSTKSTITVTAKDSTTISAPPFDSTKAISIADGTDTAESPRRIDTAAAPFTLSPRYPSRLKFSPDMVTFGLGLNSVYGYAGQWLISLSDLMGDHRIVFSGQIQDKLDEYAQFFLYYNNSRNRFDYGLGAFYNRDYTNTDVAIDSLFHDITTGGIVHLQYPFSLYARTEFNAYYSHVKRSAATEQVRIDTIGDSTIQVPFVLEREFDIFIPTLSAVWDNTLWGITGPVNGVRAQASLTAVPPLKSMDASYLSLDVDARNYVHLARKFVLATRLAAGGSVSLQESKRSRRYFLGGSDYWLNYDVNRKNSEKNISNFFYSDFIVPFRGWDYCDLVGSRYAVTNVEFRFPFIREIDIVFPLPMTLRYLTGVVFADAGNAWDTADEHTTIPLPRDIYGGIGFGMRANLGFFVLRYDRAWQTDWHTYMRSPKSYFSLGADF